MILNIKNKQLIVDILRRNNAVVGYLFGSYARGTAGVLSDFDVAVAFPIDMSIETQDNKIEDIRSGLEKIYGRDKVDVMNIPKLKTPLLRYIITLGEGILLFTDDRSLLNNLVDFARRDYEDTKPLRAIQGLYLKSLFI
ncbi:MAG: nucleotidyltransferase domain-containing protein [bacterium]|nr:nucleotidyltransferase domain-containing protein [bacterium]